MFEGRAEWRFRATALKWRASAYEAAQMMSPRMTAQMMAISSAALTLRAQNMRLVAADCDSNLRASSSSVSDFCSIVSRRSPRLIAISAELKSNKQAGRQKTATETSGP